MAISASMVKQLREKTGLGMMDCKQALEEAAGDMEKAVEVLRKKGMATADKRAGRAVGQGFLGSYVHFDGKTAAMVELNCETDFVARNDDFRALAKNVAMHIVAANPLAVSREEIPADVIAKERAIYTEQVKGKPANIVDKIVDGKMVKFYEDKCLLDQPFVKEPERRIQDLLLDMMNKTGERIAIRRFTRFAVGEESK